MRKPRVLIIGGGAAGLSAAIASARQGAAVTVLEAGHRVGRKILASGNGRCNLTNTSVAAEAYNCPEFVGSVVEAYPYEGIRAFFGDMGLLVSADDEGRVYPLSRAASSVLDVMRLECEHLGVDVRCESSVDALACESASGEFVASSSDGAVTRSDTVVVATGGGGALLGSFGHGLVEMTPVLGPIKTDTEPIRGLSGVRVKCAATLLEGVSADGTGGTEVASERGELLFRDYGVSGIMVFDLSRHLEDASAISIDFFPDIGAEELKTIIAERRVAQGWRRAETFFTGMLHDRVARAVLRAAGVSAGMLAGKLPVARLSETLKDFRLEVLGMADPAQAQVTRGGASVEEFDPKTMASRRADGLFAAGEVLDVDGRSGGFNLHWAWASGIVAGEEAARVALARGAKTGATLRDSE